MEPWTIKCNVLCICREKLTLLDVNPATCSCGAVVKLVKNSANLYTLDAMVDEAYNWDHTTLPLLYEWWFKEDPNATTMTHYICTGSPEHWDEPVK